MITCFLIAKHAFSGNSQADAPLDAPLSAHHKILEYYRTQPTQTFALFCHTSVLQVSGSTKVFSSMNYLQNF